MAIECNIGEILALPGKYFQSMGKNSHCVCCFFALEFFICAVDHNTIPVPEALERMHQHTYLWIFAHDSDLLPHILMTVDTPISVDKENGNTEYFSVCMVCEMPMIHVHEHFDHPFFGEIANHEDQPIIL